MKKESGANHAKDREGKPLPYSEEWLTEKYGPKQQINGETFPLADGTVIPIYRRAKAV